MFDNDAPPEKPNPECQAMKDRMAKIEDRIEKVEGYLRECDDLHKKNEEQTKRNDDAIKHNTESNILATKSINELNVTISETFTDLSNSITKLTDRVDGHDPVVEEVKNRDNAKKYIKEIILGWGGIAAAIMAIIMLIAYGFHHFIK